MPLEPNTLNELAKTTDRDGSIGQIIRPTSGWLRPIREALGLTLADLAKRLKVTPPAVRSFERAEAEDRITLASLRRTAAAMECELVYVLVPRTGTLATLAEIEAHTRNGAPDTATPSVALPTTDDPAKKVTDLTWHTLHGEF